MKVPSLLLMWFVAREEILLMFKLGKLRCDFHYAFL